MEFLNIEFVYTKKIMPIKIRYYEKKIPTYIEFLVMTIISEHPDRDKSLSQILIDDFNIKKQDVFYKAINELKQTDNLLVEEDSFEWDKNILDYQLSAYKIRDGIVEGFRSKNYEISNELKYETCKYSYDEFTNNNKILSKNEKSIKGNKSSFYSYVYESVNDSISIDSNQLSQMAVEFMKNSRDSFAKGDTFDTVLDSRNNLIETRKYKEDIEVEKVYVPIALNFDQNTAQLKCTSTNKAIENRINNDPSLLADIFNQVVSLYSERILEHLLPIDTAEVLNQANSVENYSLANDLYSNSNQDVCLINGRYINQFQKLLDDTRIMHNVKYVIVYNSKNNLTVIEKKKGKTILNLLNVTNPILVNSSITLVNTRENEKTSYTLFEKQIYNNLTMPVFNINRDIQLDLVNLIFEKKSEIQNQFINCINSNDAKLLGTIIELLNKISSEGWIEPILEDHLSSDIKNTEVYNSLIKNLKEMNEDGAIELFEKVLVKVLSQSTSYIDSENYINLCKNYSLFNLKNLIEAFEKANYNWTWSNTENICSIIESRNFDPWKNDVIKCNTRILHHYQKTNSPLSKLNSNSKYLNYYNNLFISLTDFNSALRQNNGEKISVAYNMFNKDLKNLIWNDNLKLKDPLDYFTQLSNITKTVYEKLNNIEPNVDDIKSLVEKNRSIEKNINSFLDTDFDKTMPLELKMCYLKHINKNDKVQDFIANNFNVVMNNLKRIYGG